jgi:hypothetical protein
MSIPTKREPFAYHSMNADDYAAGRFHSHDDAMSLSQESKYPSRRTYVLKLRSDANTDLLAGRLENIVTGRRRAFESGRELLESLATELASGSGDLLDAADTES